MSAKNSQLSFVKSTSLFENLNEAELIKIFSICKSRKFEKNELIMSEGEGGTSMFLLCEGEVEIVKPLVLNISKGTLKDFEKSISVLKSATGASNFFGEMALLSNAPRSATARAVKECMLYEIEKESFDALCKEDPALGYKILRVLSLRLVEIVNKSNRDILKLTTALSFSLAHR